jgi:hypothetical protein
MPLLDAGWSLREPDRDETSAEFGDSVFFDLVRDGITVNVEYYEHGQLVAYPAEDDPDTDGEPTEPYFSIEGSTPESSRQAFEAQDWLQSGSTRG